MILQQVLLAELDSEFSQHPACSLRDRLLYKARNEINQGQIGKGGTGRSFDIAIAV